MQPEYWDIFGKHHEASPSVLKAILKALGPEDAAPVSPSIVVTEGTAVDFPNPLDQAQVLLENGQVVDFSDSLSSLPGTFPTGYHNLKWVCGDQQGESYLIVCPPKVWAGDDHRHAGVAISLYGLRSARNWGCGDFRDLKDFCTWFGRDIGGSFVALNPLHAIHNRQPFNTSPYLPLSGFFRNFLYLDVEAIDGFRSSPVHKEFVSPEVQRELAELRASEYVEYERIAKLKLHFLRELFARFEGSPDFERFQLSGGGLLHDFALFCSLDEYFRETKPGTWVWKDWPAEYHQPHSTASQAFAREHPEKLRFHCWLQWQIDRQLQEVQAHALDAGMPIGLYHDLALATDRFGCDLWAHPDHFATGCRVGAPPDAFSPEGQDWAFPPPNSTVARREGYQLFAASIRHNASPGGALRIDHVMRMFRLFWIPEGNSAKTGTYVHEPWRDLLGILALESHRLRFRVIGEDLGTVSDEIRSGLNEYGVLSYKVLYFMRDTDNGFLPPERYDAEAVATVTTHDLPTLTGFWTNRDIEARWQAKLLSPEDHAKQLADRSIDKQKLLDLLHREKLLPAKYPSDAATIPNLTPELHDAIISMLAQTPCSLLAINQEDLTLEPNQQNLPGSTAEYPNWRRKMKITIEDLRHGHHGASVNTKLRHWLRNGGRLSKKRA